MPTKGTSFCYSARLFGQAFCDILYDSTVPEFLVADNQNPGPDVDAAPLANHKHSCTLRYSCGPLRPGAASPAILGAGLRPHKEDYSLPSQSTLKN